MSKKTQNHAHKLRRKTYKTTGSHVFFCTLPDCYFKTEPELLLGKRAICNRCGHEFIMNQYSITLVKPHCDDCTIKRGNHYEKRANADRRHNERREVPSELPAPAVAASIAAGNVSDLESRLKSASVTEPINTTGRDMIIRGDELIIKEYNPDEDEL